MFVFQCDFMGSEVALSAEKIIYMFGLINAVSIYVLCLYKTYFVTSHIACINCISISQKVKSYELVPFTSGFYHQYTLIKGIHHIWLQGCNILSCSEPSLYYLSSVFRCFPRSTSPLCCPLWSSGQMEIRFQQMGMLRKYYSDFCHGNKNPMRCLTY